MHTKTHIVRLLAKLGAKDRIQLDITAYQVSLLDTEGSQLDHLTIRSAPVSVHRQL